MSYAPMTRRPLGIAICLRQVQTLARGRLFALKEESQSAKTSRF
jgi:hypothetical protein